MEIVLCVTGSIAAVETVKLARELRRHGASVKCFMSDDACNIIHPNALEFATGQKVVLELTGEIEHVKYAEADLILVAPATANLISKFAYKIADNPISTLLITAYGYGTPIVFVPSMHDSMYKSISENIEKIKEDGIIFMDPKREEGKAKFPSKHEITLQCLRQTSGFNLNGKKVLITAGGTYEPIDSVRGITNRSSGKMGIEIAKKAFIEGADVTIVTGRMDVHVPKIFKRVRVESADEMQEKLEKLLPKSDIYVAAGAVSDFTVENSLDGTEKISSSEDLTLNLKPTPKLINRVKDINPEIFLIGFKAEYNVTDEELIQSARKRMKTSKADFMVANDVFLPDAGFGSDKNQVIVIDGDTYTVPLTSKKEVADLIVKKIIEMI